MNKIRSAINIKDSFRALRHRNFRLFFWGQLVSVTGTWMQTTAQQWLIYRITGSQTSLGLVTFITYLPILILSIFMGVVVDRFPRRKILLITQSYFLVGAFILAALTWTGSIQYWQILVLSFMLGIGSALDMPARQAFISEMVNENKNDLLNAFSLNSTIFNVARIIGPVVGGMTVAALGEAPTFAINGLSYLAVIAALFLMVLEPIKSSRSTESNLARLKEGFQYIGSEKNILGLVILVAAFSFVGYGSVTLVPVFAKDILKIGVTGFGQMLSWQGVGSLIGGGLLILLGDQFHKGRLLFFSRILIGPAILGLAFSRTPWISMAIITVLGYALITQLVISNTLIQTIVPDDLRGRVISTSTWALGGFYPLGSLLIGLLGDQIGAPRAAVITGAVCIAIIILNQILFPSIQKLN